MMTKQIIDRSRGQVALVVLLISAVILTLGLSISRKTVVETRIDTDEELLRQAFNTAESGVDYYLSTGDTNYILEDGSSASVKTSNIGEGSSVLDFDEVTMANQNTVFWMSGHNEDGTIQLLTPPAGSYYGGSSVNVCVSNDFTGALKVDYFYNDGDFKVKRMGYNINSNDFVSGFANQATVNCTAKSGMKQFTVTGLMGSTARNLMVAVTPLSATVQSTRIVLHSASGENFPSQGEEIIGTGTVTTEAASGTVTSMVRVYNKYRIPSFMLDAVTSLSSIN